MEETAVQGVRVGTQELRVRVAGQLRCNHVRVALWPLKFQNCDEKTVSALVPHFWSDRETEEVAQGASA